NREQIHQYLRAAVEEFGIHERIRFHTRVTKVVFDGTEKRWIVHTTTGIFTSQFLLNGNGYFSDPYVPGFQGADEFAGEIVHTADLDDRRRFADKNVVVVGSGSTAICCAPELAPPVSKSLVLVQRSPSYIYEITNKTDWVTNRCQDLYKIGVTAPLRLL